MSIKFKACCCIFLLTYSMVSLGWNEMGHKLIAQIAYDEMTPQAKQRYAALFHQGKVQSFMNNAVWLDKIRSRNDPYYNDMHYVDIPFSTDGSALPDVPKHNAISAIENATMTLSDPTESSIHRQEAAKIVLHVVGDIHQPLHAAMRVSTDHQQGDMGGNLVLLNHNAIAKNLHAYWDRGAGFLIQKKRHPKTNIQHMAEQLLQQYPCNHHDHSKPSDWANESHALAVHVAYRGGIDKSYQRMAQQVVKQRITMAGCRLAELMNQIN